MELHDATRALSALSQPSRLNAFRMLVRSGAEGMPAGDIARALEVPHNTLSSHLAILLQAGLISSERQSRSIIYRINFDGTRALFSFLLEDCCQGNPDDCLPILDSLLPTCGDPKPIKPNPVKGALQ